MTERMARMRTRSAGINGKAETRGQEELELIPLEEQIEAVRSQGTDRAAGQREKLYGGFKGKFKMKELARTIAEAAPLYVFGSPDVLENPATAFNAKARTHGFDDVADDEYIRMRDAADALAPLWRDKACAAPEDVAEAALIHTVLADDELRVKAIARCEKWVDDELGELRQDPS